MSMTVKTTMIINLQHPEPSAVWYVSVGDKNSRRLQIYLIDGDTEADMTDVASAEVRILTPEGNEIKGSADIMTDYAGNKKPVLSYILDDSACESSGRGSVTVILTGTSGEILTSFETFLEVRNQLNEIVEIGGTLEAGSAQVLEGYSFLNSAGVRRTGSIVDNGVLTWTPTGAETRAVASGFYSGGTLDSSQAYQNGYQTGYQAGRGASPTSDAEVIQHLLLGYRQAEDFVRAHTDRIAWTYCGVTRISVGATALISTREALDDAGTPYAYDGIYVPNLTASPYATKYAGYADSDGALTFGTPYSYEMAEETGRYAAAVEVTPTAAGIYPVTVMLIKGAAQKKYGAFAVIIAE